MSKIDEALQKIKAQRYQLEEYEDTVIDALVKKRQTEKRRAFCKEWIPIKVKYPPLHHKVLICTENKELVIGSLVACWGTVGNWHYKWSCYTKNPIAWMELPEPYCIEKE